MRLQQNERLMNFKDSFALSDEKHDFWTLRSCVWGNFIIGLI